MYAADLHINASSTNESIASSEKFTGWNENDDEDLIAKKNQETKR